MGIEWAYKSDGDNHMSMLDQVKKAGNDIWVGYNLAGMSLLEIKKKIANVPIGVIKRVVLSRTKDDGIKTYINLWKRLGSEQE